MNIHEHQAKEILARYGVVVPKGQVAFSVDEAMKAADALPVKTAVVLANGYQCFPDASGQRRQDGAGRPRTVHTQSRLMLNRHRTRGACLRRHIFRKPDAGIC